jgi:glycosyltransferase involved in cell wall biosynthesis
MQPKRVAIVAEWLTSRGGAEKVVDNLLKIFPEADLYTSIYNPRVFPEYASRSVRTTWLQKIPFLNKKHQLLAPLLPIAMRGFEVAGYDLIISSSSSVGKFIKKSPGCVHVCYCHTPMRYAWEPKTDNRIIKLPLGKLFVKILKKWDLKSNDKIDYFISNSKYTAERIKKFYNRTAKVIYPPVDVSDTDISNEEKSNFYFCISRLVGYKRIDLAIKSCIRLNEKLVVAGKGPELENLKKIANKHENIKVLGAISDNEKKQLYRSAKAVIFPADEDFGIVPIEANSCGTVVIALNRGGCKESLIEGTNAVMFNDQTVDDICAAIKRLGKMHFDSKKIATSAQKFSAKNFSKNIKEFINSIEPNNPR